MFRPIKLGRKWHVVAAIVLLAFAYTPAAFSAGIDIATEDSVDIAIEDNNVAQETNKEEIQIQADYMKFDLVTSSSTYKGNVNIVQGTIQLTGENVTITRKDDAVSDIQVDGNPARYLQDEASDNKVYAVSKHMKYDARTRQLVMTVDASLEQSDQTVTSQRIVYDTQNKIILAGKDSSSTTDDSSGEPGDRVNITLTPKKEAAPNTGEPAKIIPGE